MRVRLALAIALVCLGASFAGAGEAPPPPHAEPPVSVKSEVNRALITIGDPVEYTVTIKHAPEAQILSTPEAPVSEELKIKKTQEIRGKEGKRVVEGRKFTLTAYGLGEFVLDPVTIQYRVGQGPVETLQTEKIYLRVRSVAQGELKTDIRGVKGVLALGRGILGLILLFLLAAGALAGFLIYRFGRKARAEAGSKEPPLTAQEEAFFALNQLFDSDLLRRGRIKEYYLRLSEILRVYFEKRFRILAVESTTDEILRALAKAQIDTALRDRIAEVLRAADLAKFAKWLPEPAEIVQINQKSKQIVELARPAEVPNAV